MTMLHLSLSLSLSLSPGRSFISRVQMKSRRRESMNK
ncbi:hypothetical protein LEMLEM_LOCUS1978, partial [Lemmus lemmus]